MAGPSGDGLIVGIDITYEQLAQRLARANATTERSAKQMENRFRAANRNINRGFQESNRAAGAFSGQGLRQVSLQLNQVAQQGGITGNYLQALAIQMPDILLAFGTLGIVAGIAAGAMIPLLSNIKLFGEEAESFEDVLKSLNTAMQDFAKASDAARAPIGDLSAEYGLFADRASELLVIQRQLAYLDSATTLSKAAEAATDLFGQLERITQEGYEAPEWLRQIEERFGNLNPNAVAAVAEALSITTDEAIILTAQIAELQKSANQGPEAVAQALRNVIEQLEIATGGAFEMNEETRAYYENLLLAEDAALRLAAVDLAANVREAADESERMMANLLAARQQEIAAAGKVYSGRGSDPRTANQLGRGEFDPTTVPSPASARSGGSSRPRAQAPDPLAGYDPMFLSAVADRVALVTAEIEALERANQSLEDVVGDAFVGIVTGADSAREAIGNLLNDIGRLFAQVGFQNLMTGIGGFGQFGGLLRTFDGGGFTGMGARAGGIDGKGGFPAILHPNETVIDHTRGQSGSPVSVVVNIDAKGARDSGQGAIAAVPQIRAAVVAAMNDANRRGYR